MQFNNVIHAASHEKNNKIKIQSRNISSTKYTNLNGNNRLQYLNYAIYKYVNTL